MDALLLAVRDHLRQTFRLPEQACEVMPDGRPPAVAGPEFWAVHPGPWRQQERGRARERVDELLGCRLTITRKTGNVPLAQLGPKVMAARSGGLLGLAHRAALAVSSDHLVRQAANRLANELTGYALTGEGLEGFVEPLLWADVRWLGPQGGDWFWGGAPGEAPLALAVEVTWSNARRVQQQVNLHAYALGEELPP